MKAQVSDRSRQSNSGNLAFELTELFAKICNATATCMEAIPGLPTSVTAFRLPIAAMGAMAELAPHALKPLLDRTNHDAHTTLVPGVADGQAHPINDTLDVLQIILSQAKLEFDTTILSKHLQTYEKPISLNNTYICNALRESKSQTLSDIGLDWPQYRQLPLLVRWKHSKLDLAHGPIPIGKDRDNTPIHWKRRISHLIADTQYNATVVRRQKIAPRIRFNRAVDGLVITRRSALDHNNGKIVCQIFFL